MRKTGPSSWACTAVVVLAALGATACDISVGAADFSVREEKQFTVSGPAQLSLTTFDGSIEVRGWDKGEVQVTVEKRGADQATLDRLTVKAAQNGNAISIEVPKPAMSMSGLRRTPSANLVVTVPVQSTVTTRSGDGSITIRRITGRVDVDTADGSVRIEDVKGDLAVHTGDGSVHVRDADGRAKITTGDGTIAYEGVVRGALVAESHDGSIEVTARRGSSMDAEWNVSTGDGNVRLDLPEGFNADLDAQTGDGRVTVRRLSAPVRGRDTDGESDDHHRSVRSTLGAGGSPLRVRTGDGSITIKAW
jgi:hypothetical protein